MYRVLFTLFTVAILASSRVLVAHEGHAPLPTRGASVDPVTGVIRLSREARHTLDIRTQEILPLEITDSWFAYATVSAPWNGHALVSSMLPGRIVSLNVRPGEAVTQGQVLAEIDSLELQALRLEFQTAQNDVTLSKKLLEQLATAEKSGAVAGQRILETRTKLRQDENALSIARKKWLSLQLPEEGLEQLSLGNIREPLRLAIRAPLTGTVIHADLSVGKIIDPKEHLFEIVAPTTMWIKINVLEKDLQRVTPGQSVNLALTAYPGKTWTATVDKVGQLLDPTTHVGTAWATLHNTPNTTTPLRPGMSGQVRLQQTQGKKRLAVPLSGVLRDGAERYVLVEQEEKKEGSEFKKQSINLGQRVGAFAEIRGGTLLPGDRIVTQGSHELSSFFMQGSLKLSRETAKDIGLEVQAATPRAVNDVFEADGMVDVQPENRSVVASPLAGIIERILVDRSQSVHAGEVIAELRSLEFQTLQFELLKARYDSDLQTEILTNFKMASNSLPQRRLLEAESALASIGLRMESLIQQLRTVGLTSSEINRIVEQGELMPVLPLRAPIDGIVVGFDKFLGYVVRADEPLFDLHDVSGSFIQAFVAERDAGRVTVNQPVRVRLVSVPSQVFEGRVIRSGQVLGDTSRALSVWIEISGKATRTWPHNALARVTFDGPIHSAALAVPVSALLREGSRNYVFVQSADGTFQRRAVTVGRRDDRFIEIHSGLHTQERVAISGVSQLQTGYAAIR